MLNLLTSVLLAFSQGSGARTNSSLQIMSSSARDLLCETLLQSDKRAADLPLNSGAVCSLLNQLGVVALLPSSNSSLSSPSNPQTQGFLRQVTEAFSDFKDPVRREAFSVMHRLSYPEKEPTLEIFQIQNVSPADQKAIRAAVRYELHKLPRHLRYDIWRSGRGLVVIPGRIVDHPILAPFRSQIVSNGTLADTTLGAANRLWKGPALISWNALNTWLPRSTALHEIFHLVDSTGSDLYDGMPDYSSREDFRTAWRNTVWLEEDWYLRWYAREAFAEGGMLYAYSAESREYLMNTYPSIYSYFDHFIRE